MDSRIITIYVLVDDLLKSLRHREDPQCRMSDAEVLTTALVAALFFGGKIETSRWFLREQNYIPCMLSKSRLNRRLHRCRHLLVILFQILSEMWKQLNEDAIYVVDSFLVPACDNIRIQRCRLYRDDVYRGYQASKRRYVYGLKVHLMVTASGAPVEFFFTPASFSDVSALDLFDFDLPAGSTVYGDKAYNWYLFEDLLAELGIRLLPIRRKNSRRPLPPWERYLQARHRKMIETAVSNIERLLPKHIHAVTSAGFELKLVLFILAASFNALHPLLV
ncbi:MAG: IS982 family transposase [Chloroflexi bacterium]|nr:MAG: IS982 family transposase [Chloroflexota bacterium]